MSLVGSQVNSLLSESGASQRRRRARSHAAVAGISPPGHGSACESSQGAAQAVHIGRTSRRSALALSAGALLAAAGLPARSAHQPTSLDAALSPRRQFPPTVRCCRRPLSFPSFPPRALDLPGFGAPETGVPKGPPPPGFSRPPPRSHWRSEEPTPLPTPHPRRAAFPNQRPQRSVNAAYVDDTSSLISTLRESILFEAGGARRSIHVPLLLRHRPVLWHPFSSPASPSLASRLPLRLTPGSPRCRRRGERARL